jgi:STE24 endopeptidase
MQTAALVAFTAAGLIVLRLGVELWLAGLNRRFVRKHAGAVPDAFKEIIDPATYQKSVDYTLAKTRLGQLEDFYHAAVLLVVLFSGVLPAIFQYCRRHFGDSPFVDAAFLFVVAVALLMTGWPFDWYAQFRLEEKFGFNTSTPRIWWTDRLKGLLLALVLGYSLLVLVLIVIGWTGERWWLWAWGVLLAFQLLMTVLAPVLIMPWFNKFTPLPEGALRDRLLALAQRTDFRAQSIQVMDGSKRSRHSNAFFTGFGRARKIVLFDTLIQQLTEPELEAVLAHEIGHYKRKHIPKMLLYSAASSLVTFFVVSILARQEWFYRAFGFEPGSVTPALLLFGLLSGVVTFWFSPLLHWWSRKYEYEADAYAAKVMDESRSLIGALRKLNEKNLSNLTPHPVYSGFYYSHPAMLEREQALKAL